MSSVIREQRLKQKSLDVFAIFLWLKVAETVRIYHTFSEDNFAVTRHKLQYANCDLVPEIQKWDVQSLDSRKTEDKY